MGPKRLYRSNKDKMIAGVAGGLAEFYQIDVIWFRVGFVALTLMYGFAILLYIVMALMVPVEPENPSNPL